MELVLINNKLTTGLHLTLRIGTFNVKLKPIVTTCCYNRFHFEVQYLLPCKIYYQDYLGDSDYSEMWEFLLNCM